MHDETKIGIIDALTTAIGSLGKEVVVHRNRMRETEARKDAEVELAKVKQEVANDAPEATPDDGDAEDVEPQVMPADDDGRTADLQAAFDELKSGEECTTCRAILEAIEEAPARIQPVALMEYGQFKQAMDDGADQERLEGIITESRTLQGLLESRFGG